MLELNTIDLLAAQAGIALNNAHLYRPINQKLSENSRLFHLLRTSHGAY